MRQILIYLAVTLAVLALIIPEMILFTGAFYCEWNNIPDKAGLLALAAVLYPCMYMLMGIVTYGAREILKELTKNATTKR
jgi:hypothetical protein